MLFVFRGHQDYVNTLAMERVLVDTKFREPNGDLILISQKKADDIKQMLADNYREAKERVGIVTSLPLA